MQLSLYLSMYLSLNLSESLYLCLYLFVYLSISLLIYLSIYLSILCLSLSILCLSLSISIYLCLSPILSIIVNLYLSLSLSIYLFLPLSIYIHGFINQSIYQWLNLSIYQSINLWYLNTHLSLWCPTLFPFPFSEEKTTTRDVLNFCGWIQSQFLFWGIGDGLLQSMQVLLVFDCLVYDTHDGSGPRGFESLVPSWRYFPAGLGMASTGDCAFWAVGAHTHFEPPKTIQNALLYLWKPCWLGALTFSDPVWWTLRFVCFATNLGVQGFIVPGFPKCTCFTPLFSLLREVIDWGEHHLERQSAWATWLDP